MGGIKHTTTALTQVANQPLHSQDIAHATQVALLKALQTHSTARAAHTHSLPSLPFAEADLEGWLCIQPQALPASGTLPTQERLHLGHGTAGTDKTALLSPQSPLFLSESLCDQPVFMICLFWL